MNKDLLKQHLQAKGMTQREFGALIGVSQATVSEWISGSKTPSPTKAARIDKLTSTKIPMLDWYIVDEKAS